MSIKANKDLTSALFFYGKLLSLQPYNNALNIMKHFRLLFAVVFAAMLAASCAPQKRTWYLQNAKPFTPQEIVENGQIRIRPFDKLTVVVNSKNPELAVPFNTMSSYGAISGQAGGANAQSLQSYTVDENGFIEMPVLGKIQCKDLTRSELSQTIAQKIIDGNYLNDPSVNIQFANLKFSIIGEVNRPGEFSIDKERITLLDALAMAGDLTVFGIREDIAVVRERDGVRTIEYVDLTSTDLFNSPSFYIQQNDVIYIKPNKAKAQSGQISQNRSFYLSLVGTAISVITLIVTLTK